MDTRDGRIYEAFTVAEWQPVDREYLQEMTYHPTPEQRSRMRVGRNDPCPCGSQKKFKKCCLSKLPVHASAKKAQK